MAALMLTLLRRRSCILLSNEEGCQYEGKPLIISEQASRQCSYEGDSDRWAALLLSSLIMTQMTAAT
jgi:hypothetical protein